MKCLSSKIALSAALTMALLSSCKDSHDGPTIDVYQNIVTFTANSGASAIFEYQELNDSPVIRLGIRGNIDTEKYPAGTRMLMTYSLPDGIDYGENCNEVQLRGLQTVYSGKVTPLPYPGIQPLIKPVRLITIYRTGHYINFTANMPALDKRTYSLYADESTVGSPDVRLYLTTAVDAESPTYNATQTGSIDISDVWNATSTRSVTVTVDNSENPYRTEFTFSKL